MSDLAKKYAEFAHSFVDPWADDGEETSFTFHFARPNKAQIKRMQDTAGKARRRRPATCLSRSCILMKKTRCLKRS